MEQKTCFVSMPFGRKTDFSNGRVIDFDAVYRGIVQPAAVDAGYLPIRADEFSGGLILSDVIKQIIASDLFLADVTAFNPDVMYELGLRHALSDAPTLVMAADNGRLPFDLGSITRTITYNLSPDGSPSMESADAARKALAEAMKQGVGRAGTTSPVYALFPDLRVELPGMESPMGARRRTRASKPPTPDAPIETLKRAEESIKSSGDVDPASVIEVMKGYQLRSAWEDLVKFSADLPPTIRLTPQIAQMTALALSRLGRQHDAIAVMQELIAQTGGDSESYGILGSIYKRLYLSERGPQYLEQAMTFYRMAFAGSPTDYYAGLNLASLLALYGGEAGRKELEQLVPQLRIQLEPRVDDPRAGFWDLASTIELAVIVRNWQAANVLVSRLVAKATSEWMLTTTANQLRLYLVNMDDGDRERLTELIEAIKKPAGVANA